MALLLAFAFISGLVTILAPCIWPLLPIILSSSVGNGGHKRSLGITLGIMFSFAVFTLSISFLVSVFRFDPNILRVFAVIVIGFLGFSMIIPQLSRVTEVFVSRLSGLWGQRGQKQGGFLPGFITGFSLGIVWSPCAGPILAAIATLAATGQVTLNLVLITAAYVAGVGIPLFLFSYGGQQLFTRTRFISAYTGRIQQVFGVLMLLTALAIYTNYDKVLQAKLLDYFPQYGQALTNFESSNQDLKKQLDILRGKKDMREVITENSLFNVTNMPKAPEFVGITSWLNSQPLTMASLRGKVILVDFWTYTCINCIRTLPFVTSWYEKYKDQGFVVVGVHTPEFAFEKDTKNVQDAIKMFGITYPVAQDNDYATWNAYNNRFWPAKYLIDAKGNVRRFHAGEGEYKETEEAIKLLLSEANQITDDSLVLVQDQTPKARATPETYLGKARLERFASDQAVIGGTQEFSITGSPPEHFFGFTGEWNIADESATAGKNAGLMLNFTASNVYLVITSQIEGAKIHVLLDGREVTTEQAGKDIENGIVRFDMPRAYHLIDLKGKSENHLLQLEFSEGVSGYAFTFG